MRTAAVVAEAEAGSAEVNGGAEWVLAARDDADRDSVCVVRRSRSLAAGGIKSASVCCEDPGTEAPIQKQINCMELVGPIILKCWLFKNYITEDNTH